jgi:putative Ca2+/H+ antiporter (TMEM165/GDT1 family)
MGNELATLSFGYLVLVAYWAVLVAELVGDRTIYMVSSLALRFRPLIVLVSLMLAFAIKMFAAVLLGKVIVRFNSRWTDLVSACAFFLSATLIWFEEKDERPDERSVDVHWSRAALVSFGSLFFTEWGDPGQISAAALVLKSHSPWAVWLGGTCAMITKGVLAMTLGVKLAERLPQRALRTLASVSCGVLGVVALKGFVLP